MRILVTGAAGFIGSHLADRLLAAGHQVVGVDAFTPYYDPGAKRRNVAAALDRGLELHEVDLARAPLAPLCEGVEYIFHAAAQPGISAQTPFEHYLENNVVATHRLVLAARSVATLRLFVNVATSSIYGSDATGPEGSEPRPCSDYGVTKLAAEQLVLARTREHALPACSLRLFSVYGPRERPEKLFPRLIRALAEDALFPLHEGAERHVRSFTYVDDVVDGMLACIGREEALAGEILNIGSSLAMTTGDAIALVEALMGRTVRRQPVPRRAGDQQATHADIRRARALLGYDPQTKPERGLTHTVRWFADPKAPPGSP